MNLPGTYRRLAEAGLMSDYSMGYSTINGFRASVASSFYWYDLYKEEQTKLRIHPFCYMDNNAITKQKLPPEQALEEMKYYYKTCVEKGGKFIPIIHNNLLEKAEWRKVYENFLETI